MSDNLIRIGSTVLMHFTLKLNDNSIAETTKKKEPARFVMTEESLNDVVESALLNKSAGEKVRIPLTPEQGYGPVLESNIHTIEKHKFKEGSELQPGDIYNFDKPNGEVLSGVIVSVKDDSVVVDFNHPLAGKHLLCELEILEVIN